MPNLVEKMGLRGSVAKHPTVSGHRNIMSSSVDVVIENKPQLLKTLRPFKHMVDNIPSDLGENGRITLLGLFDVFKKHGNVKEGIAEDIIWGFHQSGYNAEAIAYGLVDLQRKGFILFQAPDNQFVDEHCTNLNKCWVRYTDKLLNLVYSY